jgi:SNF2 family DNA or RNA helicase
MSVDRSHRIGQTKPVDIRRLVVENSVEQRIMAVSLFVMETEDVSMLMCTASS